MSRSLRVKSVWLLPHTRPSFKDQSALSQKTDQQLFPTRLYRLGRSNRICLSQVALRQLLRASSPDSVSRHMNDTWDRRKIRQKDFVTRQAQSLSVRIRQPDLYDPSRISITLFQ